MFEAWNLALEHLVEHKRDLAKELLKDTARMHESPLGKAPYEAFNLSLQVITFCYQSGILAIQNLFTGSLKLSAPHDSCICSATIGAIPHSAFAFVCIQQS